VIEQRIAGHHFVFSVAVEIMNPRVMARVAFMAPQDAPASVHRPDVPVPVLQQPLAAIAAPGQVRRNDAVVRMRRGKRLARFHAAAPPVEREQPAVHDAQHLEPPVAIAVDDLRRIVRARTARAGVRPPELPQQPAVQIERRDRPDLMGNVPHILPVVRLREHDFHPAVPVQIAEQHPAARAGGADVEGSCQNRLFDSVSVMIGQRRGLPNFHAFRLRSRYSVGVMPSSFLKIRLK